MVAITIFAFATWWFTPEEQWLSKQQIKKALEGGESLKVDEREGNN